MRKRLTVTNEEAMAAMKTHVETGVKYTEIAKRLGVSYQALANAKRRIRRTYHGPDLGYITNGQMAQFKELNAILNGDIEYNPLPECLDLEAEDFKRYQEIVAIRFRDIARR